MRLIFAAAAGALLVAAGAALAQDAAGADPFQWLEDINAPRSLDWVKGQNEKSLAVLQGDRRYETFRKEALAIFTAKDRIPTPNFRSGAIDNYWQDDSHPRGLWRRTTLKGYRAASPAWKTVLDLDALARAEKADWYWKGATCLQPAERYCLLRLSDGGKDAVTEREFDSTTGEFVKDGFVLPEGKQNTAWLDKDTLLVSRDWGPGTLTDSGYAFILKRLKRGQSLDQAQEVFRGTAHDVSVSPQVLRSADGKVDGVLYDRSPSFFEREHYLATAKGPVKLDFPAKNNIQTYVDGQLVFSIEENWKGFRSGDLLAYDLKALKADPAHAKAHLVTRPTSHQSIENVASTRHKLVVTGLDDVKGFIDVWSHAKGKWAKRRLPLPKDISVNIIDTATSSEGLFFETQGLLSPTTLWFADAAKGAPVKTKALPARFDASKDVVEQFWATSTDGTKIPYFLVHRKDIKLDGSTPTIMYGYGGFQLSKPSIYVPEAGKIWFERGGAYVIADIRGGGEFGPAWHQAVLRENRQKSFDDFASVARDLFKRGITSPRRLGIYGRSNGGVLMSVSLTQHPELWNAVVVESPLVDMLRYHKLSAGASWVGEYGNPDDPKDYAFIAKYSGYQNLRPGMKYPKPLITTNSKDDRVHPGHARKFAARMESMGYPYLYFEDNFGGHSYDADPSANAARWARHYVYLFQQLMD